VDRTHVLATAGMDAHSSYVALSRHRDGMELHYGRDDFADGDRLVRALSRDRAKDMASDYERSDTAQDYAERRGIIFRERVVEIVKKIVPEQVCERIGDIIEGMRSLADGTRTPERVAPDRKAAEDPEDALRSARRRALVRHARASDAVIEAKQQGFAPSVEQRRELGAARRAFDEARPHGWQDAEAAYSRDNSIAREASSGRIGRDIRALQLETEIRTGRDAGFGTDLGQRSDRFVERWQKLDRQRQHQYAQGDYAGCKATRVQMGDMARSLERDPQLESLLAARKKELGISLNTGRSLGRELAHSHGIDFDRSRGLGI
ncbi:MAG: Ti-type conjugative transfer relaxase TraA, partial [Sphingomonas hengshuiensis]